MVKLKSKTFVLIGETDKWAHFSPQRIKHINNYYEWATIELTGAIGEKITFYTGVLGTVINPKK